MEEWRRAEQLAAETAKEAARQQAETSRPNTGSDFAGAHRAYIPAATHTHTHMQYSHSQLLYVHSVYCRSSGGKAKEGLGSRQVQARQGGLRPAEETRAGAKDEGGWRGAEAVQQEGSIPQSLAHAVRHSRLQCCPPDS